MVNEYVVNTHKIENVKLRPFQTYTLSAEKNQQWKSLSLISVPGKSDR